MVKAQRLKELLARYHRELTGALLSARSRDAQLQRWQDDKGGQRAI